MMDWLKTVYSVAQQGRLLQMLAQKAVASSKIAVEFSSPNIAKPFHMGHLRSTFAGNAIANGLQATGRDVLRLNYLGDWGTQFGLLAVGFSEFGDYNSLAKSGTRHLYDVYVKANQRAKTDPDFYPRAQSHFQQMEQGIPDALRFWQDVSELSKREMNHFYDRLGVPFDHVQMESQYSAKARQLITHWLDRGVLQRFDDGHIALDIRHGVAQPRHVVLMKSDSTLLYLTRDLAAALDRFERFGLERLYYVVGQEQSHHFENMRLVFRAVGMTDIVDRIEHIPFLRVEGMSTREGTAVFVEDVLSQGRDKALAFARGSPNTRLRPETQHTTADTMAIGALKLQTLKHSRMSAYKVNWEEALAHKGDTATRLQYTHARLRSIEAKAGVQVTPDCNVSTLSEPEALELLQVLQDAEQHFQTFCTQLEPARLIAYMFKLAHSANRAHRTLRVKDASTDKAKPRLLLFVCARSVLGALMECIGLKPLDEL